MKKPWLTQYPPGVPAEVDTSGYSSLTQLLEESFKRNAQRPFSVCMERWMRYDELDALSARLGGWLQNQGLENDARVAIMLPNLPSFPVTMAGVLRAGYTCVNVNPLYTARELRHQLQDSGATAIVILENFAHTLEEVIDDTDIQTVVVASMGDLMGTWYGRWLTFAVRHLAKMVPAFELPLVSRSGLNRTIVPLRHVLSPDSANRLRPVQVSMDSVAFLQYTGGTTGLSKGAILTHGNVVTATLQAEAWFSPAFERIGDVRRINSVAALPLYHIFALTLCFLGVRWGSLITLIPNPRDIPTFVATLKKRPFHLLPGVNTLFNALLQNAQFRSLDFSSLCVTQAGGMAASEGTARQWQQVTGSTMVEGWGMSETCALGTNNLILTREFTGTIGLPVSGVELSIRDDQGEAVELGQSGEICIRGPNVMKGYYRQPDETRKAFTEDGFMRTGDIGIMDERGYTRIVDRKKDMIIVSGFNVFPNELENVVSLCPGVIECAAVGVPDSHQGESIKLFVVRSDPVLSEEDVMRYCRENLTAYKVPRYIEFRDELPKSNVGKILRRELRAS